MPSTPRAGVQDLRTASASSHPAIPNSPFQHSSVESKTARTAGFQDIIKRQSEQDQVKKYQSTRRGFLLRMDHSAVGIWLQYLDFAEKEGDHEKVIGLYEQCLIQCATCPHIWMQYVSFLEDANMITDASAALSRALNLVEEREASLEMCLFSANYKERIGDIHGARQQYHEIYSKINPVSLEALEAHANFERRLGDHEKACSVYEDAITAERKLGKVSDLPALLVKYAFFAYAVLENPNKSRQILSQLDNFNLTNPVIKAVIDLSSCLPEKDMLVKEFLGPLVQKYLLSDLSDEGISTKVERREISLRYLDFLDNFGDINSICAALTRHISLFGEEPHSSSFNILSLALQTQPVRRKD